jgi:hypothetical protein
MDPMILLMRRLQQDDHPGKVDLGVGVYRNEQGKYYEFPSIKKVWQIAMLTRGPPGLFPELSMTLRTRGDLHQLSRY